MGDFKISGDVIAKVTSALNMAIGISSLHAKDCMPAIIAAANELDDQINRDDNAEAVE